MTVDTPRPTVSIIIPCYNDGEYLREAVASAQAQTYKPCEVILIDDHSDEASTQRILQELRMEGLTVITTPQGKKGPSAARNAGIESAQGEYILPVDADDKLAPTYVEKAVAVLLAQPQVGICYCRAKFFGLKRGPWPLTAYDADRLLYENMIFATALYRKADWEAVGGYDESARTGLEDHSFWISLHALGRRAVQLQEELFFYRVRAHSRTAQLCDSARRKSAIEAVFTRNAEYISKNALVIYRELDAALEREGQLRCLVSYKFLSPLFRLEWRVRQWIKGKLGRA